MSIIAGHGPGLATGGTSGFSGTPPTTGYGGSPIPQFVGQPSQIILRKIFDHELDMLAKGGSKKWGEAFWTAIGALIASLAPAGEAIYKSYFEAKEAHMTAIHLLFVGVFVASLVASLILYIARKQLVTETDALV